MMTMIIVVGESNISILLVKLFFDYSIVYILS